MPPPPHIGTHLAALNLFHEGPNHYELTVSDARGFIAQMTDQERGEMRPSDLLEPLIIAAADRMRVRIGAAIPMVLHCPRCGTQHIDQADPANGWHNPPHRSHSCQKPGCGCIWRPSDLPTKGVAAITSSSAADTWSPDEGATLASIRALAAIRLERAVHECQHVPLCDRGDYLANIMAEVAGPLLLRPAREVGDICREGPTNGD